METVRKRVLVGLKNRLDQAAKPEIGSEGLEPTIHRARSIPIQKDDLPAVAIFAVSDGQRELDHESYDHRFRVAAELRVKTPDEVDEPTDDLLEELIAWVVSVVMGDPTLGGKIHRLIRREVSWADAQFLDRGYGACQVVFEASFSTPDDDETTLS
ncbi:MAG: hypothetical protein ACOC5E_01920 [Acidobacteriota bacterium]